MSVDLSVTSSNVGSLTPLAAPVFAFGRRVIQLSWYPRSLNRNLRYHLISPRWSRVSQPVMGSASRFSSTPCLSARAHSQRIAWLPLPVFGWWACTQST